MTVLEKRGNSITINRKILKDGVEPTTSAQYPTVTDIEIGMHSIDAIGNRMYTSKTSVSRVDPTPDPQSSTHNRKPSPEVDDKIYGVQSHLMSPRQQQILDQGSQDRKTAEANINNVSNFNANEVNRNSSPGRINSAKKTSRQSSLMSVNTRTHVISSQQGLRQSSQTCIRFDQRARKNPQNKYAKQSNRISYRPSIVEVTQEDPVADNNYAELGV